jgi:hypothetical protein
VGELNSGNQPSNGRRLCVISVRACCILAWMRAA